MGNYDVGAGVDDATIDAMLRSGDAQLLLAGQVDIVGASPFAAAPGGGMAGLHPQQVSRLRNVVAQFKQAGVDEAVANLKARSAMGIADRPFGRANKVPAGFELDLDASGSGASSTIQLQATVPFRPVAFSFPPEIASWIRVTSVNVGQKSMILGNAPIPASCLLPDAVWDEWQIDTIQTSQTLYIGVENISGQALTCAGAIWGTMVT